MSVLSRFTSMFRRKLDDDLSDELLSHVEMRTEENIASGMEPDEARRAALRSFGNFTRVKEQTRRADILPWLESVLQDLRYAARTFRKSPAFTATAILTLAIGIGANTAVFTVLRAVLLRGLPFPDAERLVRIDETDRGGELARSGIALKGVSPPDLATFREQTNTFEQIAGWTDGSAILSGNGEPRRISTISATYNLFRALGVRPLAGRDFLATDETKGAGPVAIVSFALAQSLGGADAAVGKMLSLDGQAHQVIGVMPRGFVFPLEEDATVAWTPMTLIRDPNMRAATYISVIGRLKPAVPAAQGKADLDRIAAQAPTSATLGKMSWVTNITGLKDDYTGPARSPLTVLAGAVGLVLLIAAANVASLCLSRSVARQREVAVRLALGASRGRVLRQLLTETLLLASISGVAGALLAFAARRALLSIAPATLPIIAPVGFDWAVVAFTVVLTITTGLAAGIAPALRAIGLNVEQVLNSGTTLSRLRHQTLHGAFVIGELALATVLLFGAGLMLRTLVKLYSVDPGFDAQNVLTAEVILPRLKYRAPQQQQAFVDQVIERVKALPNVESASATSSLPMSGTRMVFHLTITDPGQPPISVVSSLASVTPDYFSALHIPLLAGRAFTDGDRAETQPVGIVNESLAKQRWPGQDPIGKTIASGFTKSEVTIVGVVRDVRQTALDSKPRPELYLPYAQLPWPSVRFAIRTHSADPTAIAADLRTTVHNVDAAQTVDKVRPMADLLAKTVADRRFYMLLLTVFAAVALVLATIGTFGLVAYAVSQRTQEIGVRMALGATGIEVLGLVMRRACTLLAVGLAVGLAASIAISRVLRSMLFGIHARDPLTLSMAIAVLALATIVASYIPARRAMQVEPVEALRHP